MAKRENSVYAGIAKELENKIKSGEYKDGTLLPPERVLKEMYGVERTTIRRALDILCEKGIIVKRAGLGNLVGSPDKMTAAVKNTGIPKTTAKKGGLIICIGTFSEDSCGFLPTIKAFELLCRKNGYTFTSVRSSDTATLEKLISSNICFGAVITENVPDEICEILDTSGLSYIFAYAKNSNCRCVLPDISGAAEQLVDELYSKGHRKIACIGTDTSNEIQRAFEKAVLQKGLDADSGYTIISRGSEQNGHDDFLTLYRRLSGRFSAVFTSNITTVKGAMTAAAEKGLEVPRQMSFVSFSSEHVSDITCAVFDKDIMAREILLSLENQSTIGTSTSCCINVGFEITGESTDAAPVSVRRNSMSDFLL